MKGQSQRMDQITRRAFLGRTSIGLGSIALASGIEGMLETWVVLARLRGEDAVEGGDSILVNEREVCSALGLLSREMAGLSEDMVWFLLQRWPKHRWRVSSL